MQIRGFFAKIMDTINQAADDIAADEKIKQWEDVRNLHYSTAYELYNQHNSSETGGTLRKKDLLLLSMRLRAQTAADINYCDARLQNDNYIKNRLNEVRRRVSKSDSASAKELRNAVDLFIGKANR